MTCRIAYLNLLKRDSLDFDNDFDNDSDVHSDVRNSEAYWYLFYSRACT